MDMYPGDIVISKAGRDKGRHFIIIERADENHVFIADGDIRRVEKPKKKKLKHLQIVKKLSSNESEIQTIKDKINKSQEVTNAEIRKCLRHFNDDSAE